MEEAPTPEPVTEADLNSADVAGGGIMFDIEKEPL